MFPDFSSEKLLPNRKGGIQHYFWIETIPPVSVWSLVVILTDHQPLLPLFGPKNPVPAHAAARLQRWSLLLPSYNCNIEYRSTPGHADAESVSRLPLPQTWSPKCENVECHFLEPEVVTTLTSQMTQKETRVDPVLSQV